jgi:hypothetical protein
MDSRPKTGSAIILAIVLTSLLAIIGVLFLISSRVDSIATSAIADSKDLTLAVDTVIAQISQDLTLDVARSIFEPNCYADYPDPCNFWLACLEPYDSGTGYRWRQISNIYNDSSLLSQNLETEILPDYNNTVLFGAGTPADADGDGVSDSIWVTVKDMNSNKGKPIFAAVRIIDNGAMLNANTGFKFNPGSSIGNKQMDINLMALSWLPVRSNYIVADEAALLNTRNPSGGPYENDVIWNFGNLTGSYTPFDISDELEVRYRFIVNMDEIDSRLEAIPRWVRNTSDFCTPAQNLNKWIYTTCVDANLIFSPDANYAYRHIVTTYNCDRIIEPNGAKMFNINSASVDNAYDVRDRIERAVVASGLDMVVYDPNQIAINLINYIDDSNDINFITGNKGYYFGFNRPSIYISEIDAIYQWDTSDPPNLHASYAIELFNPYFGTDLIDPSEWRIKISSMASPIYLTWPGNTKYCVIHNIDPAVSLTLPPADSLNVSDSGLIFAANDIIELQRKVKNLLPVPPNDDFITVDANVVPADFVKPLSSDTVKYTYSNQRDITPHKCIRRLWHTAAAPALGNAKSFPDSFPCLIQAFTENRPFTSVGDIGRLFYGPTYNYGGFGAPFTIPVNKPEDLLIDVNNPLIQTVFKYLTVIDPCDHGVQAANESRIKGRININTAPWFVIAQLPWVTNDLAQAIVAFRDKFDFGGLDYYSDSRRIVMGVFYPVREDKGFASIGELMNVTNILAGAVFPQYDIQKHAYKTSSDLTGLPDISLAPDGAENDFEERDVIFARISNLVTVRSDVFTAYILVRIGAGGPQKRVIAILDRSNVTPAGGKVKIVAIQNVPDPR